MIATFARMPTHDQTAQTRPRVDDFVERLSHPAIVRTNSPFAAFFQTLISFGLLPLVLWPARWVEFVDAERRDLIDLAAWWQRRADANDALELEQIAGRLRPRPILMVIPWLVVAFNVVVITMVFRQGNSIDRMIDLTFKHAVHSERHLDWTQSVHQWEGRDEIHVYPTLTGRANLPLESNLYAMWVCSLCVAYGCHWYAVRSHAAAVHALVGCTNKMAKESRLSRINNDVLKVGLGPLGVIFCIVLCSGQIWWAIPMVLAGSMQRRYCGQSSPAIRVALAGQTREAFAMTRSGPDRFCTSGSCGARLPLQARFCSRCGMAV